MKNSIILYFIAFIGFIFSMSSCSDVTEEIWLENNGSGKYEVFVDMSSMMSMAETFAPDSLKEKENEFMRDTIIKIFDIVPDSITEKLENPNLLKKAEIRINADKAKAEYSFTFHIDFDKIGEIGKIFDEFKQATMNDQGNQLGQTQILENMNGLTKNVEFLWKKGELSRSEWKTNVPEPEKDKEMATMMNMMFANAKMITIYHLPKKVKSVSDKSAIINGNTVTIERPLLDYMENKVVPELVIKYRKWF